MVETVAGVVGRTLTRLGVTTVFGVVGSGNYEMTASMTATGATFHATRHESAAISAADAHWRASGVLAAASLHQGPGFTNGLTALAEAAKARSPLIAFAGSAPEGALRSTFRIDQRAITRELGGIGERVYAAETVVEDVVRAWRRAREERRPVLLDVPIDLQANPATDRPPALPPEGEPRPPASVSRLAALLDRAEAPLLLLGRGAWLAGADQAVAHLADRLGATIATSLPAAGLLRDHPRQVGIAGGFSSARAVAALERADVVVALGCSLTAWTTRGDSWVRGTTVVQVDDDPTRLGLNPWVDEVVLGDVAAVVDALLLAIAQDSGRPTALPSVDPWPVQPALRGVHPGAMTEVLDQVLPRERTLVVDGGHFIGWPITGLSVPDPAAMVFTGGGFQSIGLGLGGAIGAAIARPDRLTVLAVGDGGWSMSLADLETLVRLALPVLVVIYDDDAYSAEVHHFGADDDARHLVTFPRTDFVAQAVAVGADGLVVETLSDLDALQAWLAGPRTGPLVVDVRIDPTIVGYWAEQDFFHT